MSMTSFGIGVRATGQNRGGSIFAGNLQLLQHTGLKSTQDKLDRQQETQQQIAFFERQKENLKNVECATAEEIAKKLEQFHSYEDEIAAARMKYNSEQMWHVMDEAQELGEKIAEEVEKSEPKTAEERLEEMAEEALGTDESKGELTESLEEVQEIVEEQIAEETEKQIEESAKQAVQEVSEQAIEETQDPVTAAESAMSAERLEMPLEQKIAEEQAAKYKSIDLRI